MQVDSNAMPPSERTTVRGRAARRGVYDRAVINAILDEGIVCHIGFVQDGTPFVIPMSYARSGTTLYIHGAPKGRAMQVLASGRPVCAEVTVVDGVVLGAIPTFHGMNYRSVVLFGRGREVTASGEKLAALEAIMEHIIPGRLADLPAPAPNEVAATMVAAVSIDEASAKIRSGPPAGEDETAPAVIWTGVLPLQLSTLDPIPSPSPGADIPVPDYLKPCRRGSSAGGAGNG